MSEEDYFDNKIMKHYIAEADAAVDAYIAARGRKDINGMVEALRLILIEEIPGKMRQRKLKIDKGQGDSLPNKLKKKQPPAAVRVEEEA